MKKIVGFLISAMALFAMNFTVAGCSADIASIDADAYAFVTIDINPSVELITLGSNVIEVKAANYDACVLLDGEDFSSMTVDEATGKIVSLAEQMGYLTDSNNQVKITVISDDLQATELLKAAAKAGAEKGSKKAVIDTESRLQDELTVKKLKEEKPDEFSALTEEKVRLIEALMEYDSSVTYETGAKMSVNELSAALKSVLNEEKEIFTSELREEYSARYTAAKQEIRREIAAVYGETYLAAWEKYVALENEYNVIETRLEKAELTEEDTEAVMQLLGITDRSLIEKGGIVKADYVFNYIDKHIRKKSVESESSAVEAALEILDGYDPKCYVLSEEELASVREAAGETLEFTTLSAFSAYLSDCKAALDDIKEETALTDEQIAQIRELKERFSSVKESVLDGMQEDIANARAQIAAEKQERQNAAI